MVSARGPRRARARAGARHPQGAAARDGVDGLAAGRHRAGVLQGAGLLAHYRFADWAEPPARRVARLVERRLDARGRFRAVGQSTSGLGGDLLLRVGLDELFHDASTEPGVARLALDADLIDWRARTRLARRRFERSEALTSADAAGAAAALSRALTAALDELAPWVESAAAD
ncbi:MAG: ABC-type transport auxiliary lipoprotein family protein [Gammaproteobacteria bacterium]